MIRLVQEMAQATRRQTLMTRLGMTRQSGTSVQRLTRGNKQGTDVAHQNHVREEAGGSGGHDRQDFSICDIICSNREYRTLKTAKMGHSMVAVADVLRATSIPLVRSHLFMPS